MTRQTVDTDVVVVGLGAMGSMTLWRLAQRGVRVTGVEQFAPGHSRGSSHGGSRIFRVAVFEGAPYVPVAQLAHRLWRELEHASGEELLVKTGALMFGAPSSEVVSVSAKLAEDHDIPHERFAEAGEMRARWPQITFADSDVGLLDRDGGALRPEAAIRAASAEAIRLGAEILPSTPVTAIHVEDDGVRVEAENTVIKARKAVVSAGAWTSRLLPEAKLPLEIRRAIMTWFRGGDDALYKPDRLPVFIREGSGPGGWGVPDVDGLGLKLGHDDASAKRTIGGPEDNSPAVASGETAAHSTLCAASFPGLDPRPAYVQVCMTTHTPDQGFVVGPLPGAEQVTLLAGFSGHGFKHASGIGEIAAQLAGEGGTPYDIAPFQAGRFTV